MHGIRIFIADVAGLGGIDLAARLRDPRYPLKRIVAKSSTSELLEGQIEWHARRRQLPGRESRRFLPVAAQPRG